MKTTVYIVEDHPLVRDCLVNLVNGEHDLEVCGFTDNGADAITHIQQLKPGITIVDLSLSKRSGLDLIKFLTDANPEENVLVLSMHDESVYANRVFRAGARGYVNKREASEQVITAIRRILAGSVYVNEAFAVEMAMSLGRKKREHEDPVESLSDREIEIFRLLAAGHETSEVAKGLALSPKTVQTYCGRIKEKLNLKNHTELLQAASRWLDSQR